MKINLKGFFKICFRATVSLGLLLWLFQRVDVVEVLSSFSTIAISIWFYALMLYVGSQVLSSVRWFVLAKTLGFGGRLWTYMKYYFVGMFFNLFLPSAIGGDVLKAFFLSRGENTKLKASYSILCDRLIGLWAMFVLGAISALIDPDILPLRFRFMLILCALGMSMAVFLMPIFQKLIGIVFPVLSERLSFVLRYWERPRSLVYAFVLSLILQFCGMYAVYLLGMGLGLPCPPTFYFAAFPMVAVLTILPISLSGLGVREGGFVYFLGLRHIPPEKAITVSLSFFAVQAAAALLGGAGYLAGVHRDSVGGKNE